MHWLLPLPNEWQHTHLPEVGSTMAELANTEVAEGEFRLLTCDVQTAGRGQKGNTWESAPGENLTFSFKFRPAPWPAAEQFRLSQIVALAAADVLRTLTDDIAVKWPNDLYWRDRKLGGMLLEHRIAGGQLAETLVGAGINVNQRTFVSDAPNPVSLAQICGREFSRRALLAQFVARFADRWASLRAGQSAAIHADYLALLYRRAGWHDYLDLARGERITATLESIAPNGLLTLRLTDGERRSFAFKEVQFLLSPSAPPTPPQS